MEPEPQRRQVRVLPLHPHDPRENVTRAGHGIDGRAVLAARHRPRDPCQATEILRHPDPGENVAIPGHQSRGVRGAAIDERLEQELKGGLGILAALLASFDHGRIVVGPLDSGQGSRATGGGPVVAPRGRFALHCEGMALTRLVVASLVLTAIAGCGLDAAGEALADAGASGQDARAPHADGGPDDGRHDRRAVDGHSEDHTIADGHPGDVQVPDAVTPHDTGTADGADTGTAHDSGRDVQTVCPATPDCSNPACIAEGYTCVPAIPAGGWVLSAVDVQSNSPCPAGYSPGVSTVSAPTGGPANCGCDCAIGALPSCVVGNILVDVGSVGMCTGGVNWGANNGQCANEGATFAAAVKVASTPGPTGGICTGTPTQSVPPNGSAPVYVCTANAPPGATGCAAGNVCTATTTHRTECIAYPAPATCPATGYTTSHTVGTAVTDTRECAGACTCGAPTGTTCGEQTWTFYSNAGCAGSSKSVNMDGNCDPTGAPSGNAYQSYLYSANPVGATCGTATTMPAPIGSATLDAESTLCCLP